MAEPPASLKEPPSLPWSNAEVNRRAQRVRLNLVLAMAVSWALSKDTFPGTDRTRNDAEYRVTRGGVAVMV